MLYLYIMSAPSPMLGALVIPASSACCVLTRLALARPYLQLTPTAFSVRALPAVRAHLRSCLRDPEHVLDAFLAERMAARASMPALGLRKPLPQWHFSMDKVPAYCGIRLLRRSRVEQLSGLPKSTFYPRIRVGLFPAQVPLGECAARWVAHEVAAWILASNAPVSRGGAVERAQAVSRPSR